MKLVTVILLITIVCAPFAGARILETDFQASRQTDSMLNTVLGGTRKTPEEDHTERRVQTSEMSKKSTFNKLPSGPSPGVGHSFTNGHVEKIQGFSKDLNRRTFNKLPSGPSPGGGHSFTDDHVEKIQAFSESLRRRTFNRLPSGPSPGVGHSFTNAHVEKMQTFSDDLQRRTFNKLPSGPSPGVGHSFTDDHVEKIQTFSEDLKQTTFNKLPSGPSPGVGHSFTDDHVEKIQAFSEDSKQRTFNKLPSGPSPGVGHSFTDGHVESIQVSEDQKRRMFNKLPSGPSPGAGHRYPNGHIDKMQTRIFAEEQPRTIEPQSGPSPGAGHMQTNSVNDRKSAASVVKTEAPFSCPDDGVGHSIPTIAGRKFNSDNWLGHSISVTDTIRSKAFSGQATEWATQQYRISRKDELKPTSSHKNEKIAMETGSAPPESIGCALQRNDQFSENQLFAVSNFYSSTPTTTPHFGVGTAKISPERTLNKKYHNFTHKRDYLQNIAITTEKTTTICGIIGRPWICLCNTLVIYKFGVIS